MKLLFKPTLEHIARVKLVSLLWNEHDIRTLLEEFSNTTVFLQVDHHYIPFFRLVGKGKWFGEKEEKWQTIETRVIEKIPQHIMQTYLKDKIISYIKPVGLQVLRWMEYHRKCFSLNLKLPSEFCWTPQGTIDKRKTAEVLIKDEDIDIITRFKLACIYCLEHDIPELWNKIPESLKVISHSMSNYIFDPKEISEMALLGFWEHFQKGSVHWENKIIIRISINLRSSYSHAIHSAALMSNKVATEYFLSKVHLSQVNLENIAVLVINHGPKDKTIFDPPREYYGEVLCFLLPQMNHSQQLKLFKKCTCRVLSPLLEWPWQTFFVEIASHLYRIIPDNGYILLLIASWIFAKVKMGFTDYNYRKMYGELWRKLSNGLKVRIINRGFVASIVTFLLEIKDYKTIILMFQHLSISERNELNSQDRAFIICRTMAEYKEWDLLKFFVPQCVTSKDEMIKFKEKAMEYVSKGSRKKKWDKLSQVLHDLVCEFSKRKSVDEGECSTSKRFCKNGSTGEGKS